MHWTLQTMLWLCAATALLNVAQWRMVGSVRMAGLLICFAWSAQEAFWWVHGDDSLALFIACDALIVVWFLANRRRVFDVGERLIAATIPFTTAIGIGSHLAGGITPGWWWIGWALVAAQMVLGFPWGQARREAVILGEFLADFFGFICTRLWRAVARKVAG